MFKQIASHTNEMEELDSRLHQFGFLVEINLVVNK